MKPPLTPQNLILLLLGLVSTPVDAPVTGSSAVQVIIETSAGVIEADGDPVHAPLTAVNFLRYVDAEMYDGGRFHGAVRLDNQVRKDVLIEVIQG